MQWPFELRNVAAMEGYTYFDQAIRPLVKKPDGSIDIGHPSVVGNDVDAFRHAHVSGVFTQEYGETVAWIFGGINEWGSNDLADKNMDYWNNEVGRKLALKNHTRQALLEAVKASLELGELITSLSDERVFSGEPVPEPQEGRSVIVLKENDTGGNEAFYDLHLKKGMSRDEFVSDIDAGYYPGYAIRTNNSSRYPAAKPDGDKSNNLDR